MLIVGHYVRKAWLKRGRKMFSEIKGIKSFDVSIVIYSELNNHFYKVAQLEEPDRYCTK